MSGRRIAILLVLSTFGCTGADVGDALRWVNETRAQSEAAEAFLEAGDTSGAADALEQIVTLAVPTTVAPEDARVVHQDAYERLARLHLQAGNLSAAHDAVERGLALGERDDIFTANLRIQRGRLREARGDEVEAARDYHRALLIYEALLDAALGGERDR